MRPEFLKFLVRQAWAPAAEVVELALYPLDERLEIWPDPPGDLPVSVEAMNGFRARRLRESLKTDRGQREALLATQAIVEDLFGTAMGFTGCYLLLISQKGRKTLARYVFPEGVSRVEKLPAWARARRGESDRIVLDPFSGALRTVPEKGEP